ncbi:MAG: hemolysin III family protein [Desulfuromonadales bacterium]|nr:hemolysin III family protein [Desulfuromonadales bacterium]
MSSKIDTPVYSIKEEIANSITHGIGLILAIAGLAVLISFASRFGNVWHLVSCTVFATTLILQYTFSTLYHSIQIPRAKSIMRVLDHSAIFLLIAGTYTPFMLVNLRDTWGWTLFSVIWTLALLGVLFQVSLLRRWQGISLSLYIGMGWVVVVAIKPMLDAVAPGGLILLLLGGLAYTSGVGFYLWKSLRYHHAIWHGFVLAGSILHFFAVLFYVIPLA